ncbi:RNA recognition motif domain-containing protein [Streptomyces microflavus]|uniref:RNA-binding protein n=1 Tax=Streptomyces microflavus TaxID=1919 RepID=A0ABV1QBL1_STRMI
MTSKVHLSNLNSFTTDEALKGAFAPYGAVLDAQVDRDPDTGRVKGTGSVTFGNDSEAQSAVEGYNGHDLNGSRVGVSLTPGGSDSPDSGSRFGGPVTAALLGHSPTTPLTLQAAALLAALHTTDELTGMGMRTARHTTRTTAATQHRNPVVLELSDAPDQDH